MSALSRCSRYARVFTRSLHSHNRNIIRNHLELKGNVFGNNTTQFSFRNHLPKRFCAVNTEESSQVVYDDAQEAKESAERHRREMRENRKHSKYSEDYPASLFWKKFDYSRGRVIRDFPSACKNIYFAIMSQKGISASEFYDFMNLVEQRDDFTDDEVKLILKTVGFLNKEVPIQEKVKWTEYLTNRFISLGIPLDVTYYNQVLRNYLQANHRFSPVEFMTSMEKQGVAPNAVTLSRFVISYCKVGDIKSASQILEHMRSSEMSINGKLYNNLILGNFIAGDKETAMQLFRDASDMGFAMDAGMYHAAIVGHALMGDLDGVKELMKEAKDNLVMFSDGAYSSMIEQVAPKGRKDIIDYFMKELTATSTFYYNETSDTLPVLMRQGNYEVAYQYYMGLNDPSGRLFYKAAMITDMPLEDVVKYSRLLKRDGLKDSDLSEYFSLAVMKYLYEPAIAVLPHLKAEGETIRPQFLWPLIQYYKILDDFEGLKKLLAYIDPADEGRTLGEFLEPCFRSQGLTPDEYRSILKKHSRFNEGQINACVTHFLMHSKGWEAAANFAQSCSVVEDIRSDMTHLVSGKLFGGIKKTTWKHMLEVMTKLNNCPAQSDIIRRLLQQEWADKEEVKKVMLEMGVTVNERTLPENFKKLFSKEELSKVMQKRYSFEDMKNMPLEDLEALEDTHGNIMIYKICVLDKSYREQKWNLYRRNLEATDITKVNSSPLVIVNAATHYLRRQGNLQMALTALDHLNSRFPDFVPNYDFVLDLCTALCKEGMYDDVLKYMSRYNYNDRQERREGVFIDCKSFFNMEATAENIKFANQLLEILSNNGYISKAKFLIHYWNFISNIEDVNIVLEAFDTLKNKHRFVPFDLSIVLGHYIRNNDKSSLQTAFDKFTDVIMEQKVLICLAAAFIENNQPDKARKVLTTPGMRLMSDSFRSICLRWANAGQSEMIEKFTTMVKSLPGDVNKEEMLSINLQAMCNKTEPDVDACIRFFETKFDEEEVEADVDTLRFYSQFLKRHNREVPFDHFTMDLIRQSKKNFFSAQRETETPRQKETETPRQKETETPRQKETRTKAVKTEVSNLGFKELLERRNFRTAYARCKEMPIDEIKEGLPDDFQILTDWVQFLINGYQVQVLECIPEESLQKIVNDMFEKIEKGEMKDLSMKQCRYLLDQQPDRLISCTPKVEMKSQTNIFVASLFLKDVAKTRTFMELYTFDKDAPFVKAAAMKIQDLAIHTATGQSDSREVYFTLLDSVDQTDLKAVAVTFTVKHFLYKKDYEGIELLAEKIKSNGLTFEDVANLSSDKSGRMLKGKISTVEEIFKSENKPIPWEPTSNWKLNENQGGSTKTKGESTEITTEKAVTDIATEIEHTEVATPKEEPVEVIVKETEKTEIFSVQKDPEEIVDTAKTVTDNTEPEMKDKATVISDNSSALGSESEKKS